jgi:hypothetical protein
MWAVPRLRMVHQVTYQSYTLPRHPQGRFTCNHSRCKPAQFNFNLHLGHYQQQLVPTYPTTVHACAAAGREVYQGMFGPWSIEPADEFEVLTYRVGLTATAAGEVPITTAVSQGPCNRVGVKAIPLCTSPIMTSIASYCISSLPTSWCGSPAVRGPMQG